MRININHTTTNFSLFTRAIVLLCVLSLVACKKNPKSSSNKDVYYTGSYFENGKQYAVFWKNGVLTKLTDGNHIAVGRSIFVDSNDVYVCGSERNDNNIVVAKVWKNGIPTSLSDGVKSTFAKQIIVSNGNIYVIGDQFVTEELTNVTSKFWINGLEQNMHIHPDSFVLNSLIVSDNITYAVGHIITYIRTSSTSSSYEGLGTLWTNNFPTVLDTGNINSVYVERDKVYACGIHYNFDQGYYISKIWLGKTVIKSFDKSSMVLNSMFVKNGSTFCAAFAIDNQIGGFAGYTKDDFFYRLSSLYSDALNIFVSDNDIYVCGYERVNGQNFGRLWKNGEIIYNSTEKNVNGQIFSVFVK